MTDKRDLPRAAPGTHKSPGSPNDMPEVSSGGRRDALPDDVARDISNDGIQSDPAAHERQPHA